MYVFTEKGLRGETSYFTKRYAKARNNTRKIKTLKNRQNL